MGCSKVVSSLIWVAFLSSSTFTLAFPVSNSGSGHGGGFGRGYPGLYPEFYEFSCPQVNDIVMSVLEKAIGREPRMAASLLRLHFHDCFVQVSRSYNLVYIDDIYVYSIHTYKHKGDLYFSCRRILFVFGCRGLFLKIPVLKTGP